MKFFTLPPSMLEDLLDEVGEDEGDEKEEVKSAKEKGDNVEEEEGEEEVDAYGNPKPKQSTKSSSLNKDYPGGSSVGVSSRSSELESGGKKKKSQSRKGFKDDGVKVITIKLDSLFQLSDNDDDGEDGDESGKSAKSSSGNVLSKILDQIMVSVVVFKSKGSVGR